MPTNVPPSYMPHQAPPRPAAPPQRIMPITPPPPMRIQPAAKSMVDRSEDLVSPAWKGTAAITPPPVAGFNTVNTSTADQAIAAEVTALQSSFSDLQRRSSFTDIISHINTIDTSFIQVSELMESARSEGYTFQSDLETTLYNAQSQWEGVRPQVVSMINQHSSSMQSQVASVNPMIMDLNARLSNPASAAPAIRSSQSYINNLLSNISRVESDLQNRYQGVENSIQNVRSRLNDIHWAMDQLAGAKFQLENGEALVMAVKARWDKEGKEDPEGLLYLSNRRLIFERKEKVATKKVLFITTASELVQEVIITQVIGNIRDTTADKRGVFKNQDYLLVQFSDPKLGQVAFHIDGQDSKNWVLLIGRVRTGQIEQERISGAGLSYVDLNKPLTQADILAVQSEVGQIQNELMLQTARQEISKLENEVNALARKLTGLRQGGYVVEKDLEGDTVILTNQWDRVKANAGATLETQAKLLSDQSTSLQRSLSQLAGLSGNLTAARPLYMQLKSAIASAQAQAGAAQGLVLAQYDGYAKELEALDTHLDWINWMLGALNTASFNLQVTECGIAATEAVFQLPGLEPENGILFLTDQRLLWEDRVGTYELKINVPLQDVLDVQKETDPQTGQQYLVFKLGRSGPLPTARVQLALPIAEDWIKMVGRARSGGYTQDRAVEVSEADLERIRNAPQQCSKCGATYTKPVMRGQNEITCEYCGLVVRI